MRVLKLWVIVDDKNIYNLSEGKPLLIALEKLPMKIIAQNGYHSSKPFYINSNSGKPLYLKIGCNADNEQFWGSIILSLFFFILFFITSLWFVLFVANIPLVFLIYRFFFKHKEFITITPLKVVYEKENK
jgi:hypothetical protein